MIQKFQDILQKTGAPHELVSFKIHNFCAASDVKFRIRLEGLACEHAQFCTVNAIASFLNKIAHKMVCSV